jgi:hypothetical protein
MMQASQWWVLVSYKDQPGSRFRSQYVAANNAYEAVQLAKGLYGKLVVSYSATPV